MSNFHLAWTWWAPQSSFSSGKLIKFLKHLLQLKKAFFFHWNFILNILLGVIKGILVLDTFEWSWNICACAPAARSHGSQVHDKEGQDEQDEDDSGDDVDDEDGVGETQLILATHDCNTFSQRVSFTWRKVSFSSSLHSSFLHEPSVFAAPLLSVWLYSPLWLRPRLRYIKGWIYFILF